MESVAGFPWNHWPVWCGICNKGVKSKAPVKASKELGVKVPRIVKDSDQLEKGKGVESLLDSSSD